MRRRADNVRSIDRNYVVKGPFNSETSLGTEPRVRKRYSEGVRPIRLRKIFASRSPLIHPQRFAILSMGESVSASNLDVISRRADGEGLPEARAL